MEYSLSYGFNLSLRNGSKSFGKVSRLVTESSQNWYTTKKCYTTKPKSDHNLSILLVSSGISSPPMASMPDPKNVQWGFSFKDVSFAYPSRPRNLVLRRVSFQVVWRLLVLSKPAQQPINLFPGHCWAACRYCWRVWGWKEHCL